MKKLLKSAAGIALGIGLLSSIQPVKAQVYNEYKPSYRVNKSYEPLNPADPNVIELRSNQFFKHDNNVAIVDRNDGFAKVNIPLTNGFWFGGKNYKSILINVNGFIELDDPFDTKKEAGNPAILRDPSSLFNADLNLKPIIAPFWGNHIYRDVRLNGDVYPAGDMIPDDWNMPSFVTSHIYVYSTDSLMVIEWKDINININEPDTIPYQSSIANFQVRLYRSKYTDVTSQGKIEFCYGSIGETGGAAGTARQEGAVVGIKGNLKGTKNNHTDFLNGLRYDYSDNKIAMTDITSRTRFWPPSVYTDQRIVFDPVYRWYGVNGVWGDGDADMSKAQYNYVQNSNGDVTNFVPGMHFANYKNDQTRYVNTADVAKIMRSEVGHRKLDSLRYQAAYHADVNHNGRFVYTPSTNDPVLEATAPLVKKDIKVRTATDIEFVNAKTGEDLSVEYTRINSEPNRIYFQANAYDASLILGYLAAKETGLPVWDNQITQGKASASETANDIVLGKAIKTENGEFRVPVYLNGYTNSPVGLKFEINGKVSNVSSSCGTTDFKDGVVAFASAKVNNESPICYLEFATMSDVLTASNIILNDENKDNKSMKLGVEENVSEIAVVNNNLELNVVKGNYEINVYDILGNKVAGIFNGSLSEGFNTLPLNLNLNNGVYFVRVIGEGSALSTKINVAK